MHIEFQDGTIFDYWYIAESWLATQVTLLLRYIFNSVRCQNSFPGTFYKNNILGNLPALVSYLACYLVSLLREFYFQKSRES